MAKVSFKRTEAWITQGCKTSVTEVLLDGRVEGTIEATEPIPYGGMSTYNIYVAGHHSWASTLAEAKAIVRGLFEPLTDKDSPT